MATEENIVPIIRIFRKTYESLKNFPLFYFNLTEEYNYKSREVNHYWMPEAIYFHSDPHCRVSQKLIQSTTGKILFAYGRLYDNPQLTADSNEISLQLEHFSPNNKDHIKALLLLYFNKASNRNDRYPYRELLWTLNNYIINIKIISDVLNEFDAISIQPFFWNTLKNLAPCLSLPKQAIIKHFLHSKGVTMNFHCSKMLLQAVKTVFPAINVVHENINIFKLIDLATNANEYRNIKSTYDSLQDNNITNFYLQIRRWLLDENYTLPDISKLATFICLTSPDKQINIVQRYFYSVWKGQASFDVELIKQFQVTKFDYWRIFHHCVYEPSLPVRLAVPLLCDNIITFLNSGQRALQTINGTLDLAYAKCDSNSPEIDFGMHHIMPLCNGGATPNINFQGFVSYQITHSLMDSAFTIKNITIIARRILSLFGHQQREFTCFMGEDYSHPKVFCYGCENKKANLIDKWEITIQNQDDYKRRIIQLFVQKDFPENKAVVVSLDELNVDAATFKVRFIEWLNNIFPQYPASTTTKNDGTIIDLPNGWILDKNANFFIIQFAKEFIAPTWFTIEPLKTAYIGRGVLDNITGLSFDVRTQLGIMGDDDTVKECESRAIGPRVTSLLAKMVEVKQKANGSFHVPYNEQLLLQIKSVFYTPKPSSNSEPCQNYPFLTNIHSKFERYCAPKFDNDINLVTQLPYFWCRGKECFRTSLATQTLSSCNSWKEFTILHLLEILGFPQITKTSGGNEASELIRDFIGMVSKAESLFKRVRCRECNHILFPMGSSQFNRYNNFECHVPTCNQYRTRVYLSQCHNCKSGLIDSRDSAKCPNGWHICPKCLSCCNDAIYERMANKYVIRHQPIPPRIKEKFGQGHNDKNQFFCPKCGGEIITVKDDHTGRIARKCIECNTLFEDVINYI